MYREIEREIETKKERERVEDVERLFKMNPNGRTLWVLAPLLGGTLCVTTADGKTKILVGTLGTVIPKYSMFLLSKIHCYKPYSSQESCPDIIDSSTFDV